MIAINIWNVDIADHCIPTVAQTRHFIIHLLHNFTICSTILQFAPRFYNLLHDFTICSTILQFAPRLYNLLHDLANCKIVSLYIYFWCQKVSDFNIWDMLNNLFLQRRVFFIFCHGIMVTLTPCTFLSSLTQLKGNFIDRKGRSLSLTHYAVCTLYVHFLMKWGLEHKAHV